MLVCAITESTIEKVLAEIEKAAPLADTVELRIDYLDPEALSRIGEVVSACLLPLIFTFRRADQGGRKEMEEKARLGLIEQLLVHQPAYCDLEADTDPVFLDRIGSKFPKTQFIGSYHDFGKTPADLEAVLNRMAHPRFSLYKIAVKANSTIDCLKLMIFLKNHSSKGNLCCISMGEFGKPSRVIGKILGNALDYSANEEEQTQLHRYNLKTLLDVFHYRNLNAKTRIYSLIGDPVEQSPGHFFHNEEFRKHKINSVYIKMKTQPEEIPEFFSLIQQLPFSGLSVTIPLKEVVFSHMDQIAPDAQQIGAINTVKIAGGMLIGSNTDAPGALNSIERHLKVKGKRVAVLGAGGTARAIVFEAKKRGASVAIFNRTADRATELAAEMGCQGFSLEGLPSHPYDLLVNTTAPSSDGKAPIPASQVIPKTAVMDVIYYPKETPVLKEANERGCSCIYGEEMFREQAFLQQETWRD